MTTSLPVVLSVEAAARVTGLPIVELWRGLESPRHIWWAEGGPDTCNDAELVAVMPGYREACPHLY